MGVKGVPRISANAKKFISFHFIAKPLSRANRTEITNYSAKMRTVGKGKDVVGKRGDE